MIKQFGARSRQQLAWILLFLVIFVYAVEMGHQTLLRYDTFKATAFDLGNMDQVLWNTIHGRLFQFTNQAVDWYGPPTRLALHFEPILLLLSLLYVFHADPRILLVFQTLALASGALPVFLLTRKYLSAWPLLAVLMAVAYLLSPALLGLNIFDFHAVSLAAPLLLYAVLSLTYRRYAWFLLACVLAASCKEDMPLAIATFGILLIWKYKLPRLGITLILGGLLWSFIAFEVITHFYPGVQSNNFWYRYESLGSSPTGAIVNLTLHPWLLFTTFITLDRLYYLASLFRSAGFVSLLAPEWLLPALPGIAVNVLSTDSFTYSGVYHYNAAIIPFVMLSAIFGTRRLITLWQGWRGEKGEVTILYMQGTSSPSLTQKNVIEWLERLRRLPLSTRLSPMIQTRRSSLLHLQSIWWQRFSERMVPLAKSISISRLQWVMYAWITFMLGLNFLIATPYLNNFWADHEPGSREQHIQQLLAMIPPDASVSAGSNLNPHLSERQRLAVFPSISDSTHNDTVQYIIVDLNAVFPEDRVGTTNFLNQLVHSGQYKELGRAEGVVLLVRRSTA